MTMRVCAMILLALVAEACGCTDLLTYGVHVTVRDAQTGDTLMAAVTGTITDGRYSEAMEVMYDGVLVGAGNRPGTYDVEIRAEGYQTWTMEDVKVKQSFPFCPQVETVRLEADMVPLSTAGPLTDLPPPLPVRRPDPGAGC